MRRLLVAALLISAQGFAQNPKYDFYPEFRNSFTLKMRAENASRQLSNDEIVAIYATELKSDGVPADEISRRVGLLRTGRPALEADYWNRFYLDAKSNFNKARMLF